MARKDWIMEATNMEVLIRTRITSVTRFTIDVLHVEGWWHIGLCHFHLKSRTSVCPNSFIQQKRTNCHTPHHRGENAMNFFRQSLAISIPVPIPFRRIDRAYPLLEFMATGSLSSFTRDTEIIRPTINAMPLSSSH
jgi:hypothetical protein